MFSSKTLEANNRHHSHNVKHSMFTQVPVNRCWYTNTLSFLISFPMLHNLHVKGKALNRSRKIFPLKFHRIFTIICLPCLSKRYYIFNKIMNKFYTEKCIHDIATYTMRNVLIFFYFSCCSMKIRQSVNVHDLYATVLLNTWTHFRITKR